MTNPVDFAVRNDGTIFVFSPLTPAAHEFAATAFANAMTFGTSYVVDHRYAMPILDDLVNEEGFTVTLDGVEV